MSKRFEQDERPEVTGRAFALDLDCLEAPVVTRPSSNTEDAVELGHGLGESTEDATALSELSADEVDDLEPTSE
jgi:hypothetical protein